MIFYKQEWSSSVRVSTLSKSGSFRGNGKEKPERTKSHCAIRMSSRRQMREKKQR